MKLVAPDTDAARAALHVVAKLKDGGHDALWAGGCVRDILLGRIPKDYDVATSATAEQVLKLFPGSQEVGKAFGVVRVPAPAGQWIEVATFREDATYTDGRRPDAVTFSDARHDAQRRDFTVNAIFYDPTAQAILDYTDGLLDLRTRTIRCVGDPAKRFAEDHLRLLRAVRFAATLEFSIEPATAAAIRRDAALIKRTSAERVFVELDRTLCEAQRAGDAIRLMNDIGLLDQILPEVSAMKGQAQPVEFHPEGDVFEHTIIMLNSLSDPSPLLAWSVLLHDVGKPVTAFLDGDRWRFNRHATEGAHMAGAILRRLKASSRLAESVAECVGGHMRFADVARMKRSTLRRFVGRPEFDVELELHRLDCISSHGKLDHYELLCGARREFDDEPVLPEPFITGKDIMAMGIAEGPGVGKWKDLAYDAQLEEAVTSREEALMWVRHAMHDSAPDGGGSETR